MKVLVFPKDSNPYQGLLYSNMEQSLDISYLTVDSDSKLKTITYMPRLFFSLAVWRHKGFKIIHIHWLYGLGLPSNIPLNKQLSYIYSLAFLYVTKLLGYKIVWTIHNVLPHEAITTNDLHIRRVLSNITSAKIIHSPAVIKQMTKVGLDTNNVFVIPIGTYSSQYPNTISHTRARKYLGIKRSAIVLLFFGRIENYKNIPVLIKVFNKMRIHNKKLHLIIAGSSNSEDINEYIRSEKKKAGSSMTCHIEFIPNDRVQYYFKAADIAVYPFNKVTTSSAIILAMDFGLPIIAPRLGALIDLPENVGYIYNPDQDNGLELNLEYAIKHMTDTKKMGNVGLKYAKTLSWGNIAEQTYRVYQVVLK